MEALDKFLENAELYDLHAHISGSIKPEIIYSILLKEKVEKNILDDLTSKFGISLGTEMEKDEKKALEKFKKAFVYSDKKTKNPNKRFKDIISRFPFLHLLSRSFETRKTIIEEICRDSYENGVRYIELRADPFSPVRKGHEQDPFNVIESYVEGMQASKESLPGFDCSLTLCITRNKYLTDKNGTRNEKIMTLENELRKIAMKLNRNKEIKKTVLGIDIVNAEVVELKHFTKSFEIMRNLAGSLPVPHAGENFNSLEEGLNSIIQATDLLKAKRIGHALAAVMDAEDFYKKKDAYGTTYTKKRIEAIKKEQDKLLKALKEKDIAIEVNPTANLMVTGMSSYKKHPIKKFFEYGVPVIIGTDDLGLFGISLKKEIKTIAKAQNLSLDEVKALISNSHNYSLKKLS